jgi:hypothetical protein
MYQQKQKGGNSLPDYATNSLPDYATKYITRGNIDSTIRQPNIKHGNRGFIISQLN